MKEVYLIRHTTPHIKPGLCYGSSDIDVLDNFTTEADSVKTVLNGFAPELVVSSPLIRCVKLTDHLFSGSDVRYDERIKEMHFGDWELKPWGEIDKEVIDNWSYDFVNISTPNGENFKTLFKRAVEFMNEVVHKTDASKVAVVTHSGVIRCLLSRYLEIPLEKVFRLKLNYGIVIKLTLHSDFEEVEFVK